MPISHPPSVEMNSMIDRLRLTTRLALVGALAGSAGCVKRTIEITSTPPEALVWVNSREVGRTPLSIGFTYDGVYDVRLRREGCEPLATSVSTDPPVWDLPGPDFVVEILPIQFNRTVRWHFDLEPEQKDPQARLARAEQLRSELAAWDQPIPGSPKEQAAQLRAPFEESEDFIGPPSPFGRPALPPDTAPTEAPVRPPQLYPEGTGAAPNT